MHSAHTPKRLRALKYLFVGLLSALLIIYLIFAIIRAVNSPILLDTEFVPTQLVPPSLIIDGKRSLFAQSTLTVQGLYLDASGTEVATGNLAGALSAITIGNQVESAFPDALNDGLNQDRVTWMLQPDASWRFGVNFTADTGDPSRLFTALRVGVKMPSTAGSPSLDLRLLQPGSSQAYLTQSRLSPVGTTAVGRNREVRYTQTQIALLKGGIDTIYTAVNLDYSMPNVTNPPDFFITLRSGNTLDESGKYLLVKQTERLAFTWYDVITGVGGLFGLLTTVYFFLFGDSKLRTWGPVQWLMRKDIIQGTDKTTEKDRASRADLSVEERLGQLEAFKDRINNYYIEHSLFEDTFHKFP